MRSSGISRRVDELGRIVIPKEMRNKLDIKPECALEITLDGDTIVLKKDISSCIFCGSENAEAVFRGKHVCPECLNEIRA